MGRPSDPLLRWLRKLMQDRKLSAASLAEAAELPRARARHILSGAEPMSVDELLQISQALKLDPTDFGFEAPSEEAAEAEPASLRQIEEELINDDGTIPFALDPLGNQPRQLFQIAFAMGCDFLFLARVNELTGSGVPATVLDRYSNRDLPIKMDAAYHQYNNPRYDDHGVTLTLSFDALYECTFPWASIRQLVFFPAAPPPPVEEEPDEEPEKKPSRPFLRLVE